MHTHHEPRDVRLSGVWGEADLFGGAALGFWVYHHTVTCEAGQAVDPVLLTRCGPVNDEGCGANLGELEA